MTMQLFQHCSRVAVVLHYIGQALGLTQIELDTLFSAATLHDLGKIKVPKEILNKNDSLTTEEYKLIKEHTQINDIILEEGKQLSVKIAESIKTHHEYYDGNGYCLGLKGENIPLNSRIIAIADAFDAMTNSRPYRKNPLQFDEAWGRDRNSFRKAV